jgi:hypothetical protein
MVDFLHVKLRAGDIFTNLSILQGIILFRALLFIFSKHCPPHSTGILLAELHRRFVAPSCFYNTSLSEISPIQRLLKSLKNFGFKSQLRHAPQSTDGFCEIIPDFIRQTCT